MNELLFGTAGIPLAAKPKSSFARLGPVDSRRLGGTDTIAGIKTVRELGLDAMELEFVHSVNIQAANAPKVKAAAEKENVALSCHAPYYINLNAASSGILDASKRRLIKAAVVAEACGAKGVVFHPGFYLGLSKEKAYENVKAAVEDVVAELKRNDCDIRLRPETTGKRTQFGDLNELIKLSSDVEQVLPCLDYAHIHARGSNNNSYSEFKEILAAVEKGLGKDALKNMHIHISGINYSSKGELNHLELKDSDLNYEELAQTWKEYKIAGTVISESPNIEADALMLKRLLNS